MSKDKNRRWNPNGGEVFSAYNDGVLYAESLKGNFLRQKNRNKPQYYIEQKIRLLRIRPNCSYCDKPLNYKSSTIDHIIPIRYGGTDKENNLCLACKECNTKKGCRDLRLSDVYLEMMKNIKEKNHVVSF